MRRQFLLAVALIAPWCASGGEFNASVPDSADSLYFNVPVRSSEWYAPFLDNTSRYFGEALDDRFNPQSVTVMWLSVRGDPGLAEREFGDRVLSSFSRSLARAGSDFGLDLPVTGELHDWGAGLLTHFTDFRDRDRSEVSPIDPESRLSSLSWRKRLEDSGTFFDYGYRPLNTSPYGFLSLSLRNKEETIVDMYMRVRYRPPGGYRMESAVVFRPTPSWYLGVGYTYEQDIMRAGEVDTGWTLRVEKIIGRRSSVFVNVSKNGSISNVLAGLARTF